MRKLEMRERERLLTMFSQSMQLSESELQKRGYVSAATGLLLCMFLAAGQVHAQSLTGSDLTLTQGSPFISLVDNVAPGMTWTISANDLTFDILNATTGFIPFTILPGAPQDSFFLNGSGSLGLGTTNPLQHFQITDGDTPTIRLEQDGSGGFNAYTFDIGQNESAFFISDVTAGTIPFSIEPTSRTDAVYIQGSGNIGLGTNTPAALIHGIKPAATGGEILARLSVADDAAGRLDINNATSTDGQFIPRFQGRSGGQNAALITEGLIAMDVGTNPVIVYNAARAAGGAVTTRPLVVYRNNNVPRVTITAGGTVLATSFNPVSSRTLKTKIVDLDSARASAALRQLTPVEFVYKNDEAAESRVGFIAEDVPEIVADQDRMSVPIMDVLALVTRVVKDQQITIDDQKQTINQQRVSLDQQKKTIDGQAKSIEELAKRLSHLESRLQGK